MSRHLALLLVVGLFVPSVFAAQVSKVKGKSALINLQGTAAAAGDRFFAMDGGKKKAIIQITKVKGDKAIGKITKGNAAAGMSLSPAPSAGGSAPKYASSTPSSSGSSSNPTGRSYWGGVLGYAMDSMSVNINDYYTNAPKGSVNLSGSGFSGNALFDYELFSQVWFRGLGGIEMFNVSGSAACGVANAEPCDAKIMYAAGTFIGRYVFAQGNFRPWVGFGIGLLFPITKSATALASNSIGTTNVMLPSIGIDWFTSSTMYVPISLEYGMLPKSDEVDAKWIALRVGMAVPF